MNGTRNSFDGNARHGVFIFAKGKVTITNIEAEYNTASGLTVDTYTYGTDGKGEVVITNANLNHNGMYGVSAQASGILTLTNVMATSNGTVSNNFAGGYLLTNNNDISITNSAFTGNVGRGITSDTGAGKTLKLVGTSFYGNDTNKSGDANLSYTGLISIS